MFKSQNNDTLYRLLLAIQERAVFNHPVEQIRIIETHISYVLLTGPYAYKFKKPLDLGFLDFQTLEKRKYYCEEELRLNKRMAPDLYIGVVAFTGAYEKPELNGSGPVLEYAVKMRQFAEQDQALYLLRDGRLTERRIDELARLLAKFHGNIAVADRHNGYGSAETILRDAMENFDALRALLGGDSDYIHRLDELQSWTGNSYQELRQTFSERKQQGYIRECHGDLHLGNIVLHGNEMLVFDCIEFSPSFHWIDVMNDLAFLVMDLQEHRQTTLAQRLLNTYLQLSGDYEGLQILRFYIVYRALVRSKVAAIRLGQSHLDQRDTDVEMRNEHGYLDLAMEFMRPAAPALLITHGLSGSGKSVSSRMLADKISAIWLRSDVERKRLHGLQAQDRSHSDLHSGIYGTESTVKTFRRLAALCRMILKAGYSVIVDAAFLQLHTRKIFQRIASELNTAFIILDFQADEAELRARINRRSIQAIDVSEADSRVLDNQLRNQEPLDGQETKFCIKLNSDAQLNLDSVQNAISARTEKFFNDNRPDHNAG